MAIRDPPKTVLRSEPREQFPTLASQLEFPSPVRLAVFVLLQDDFLRVDVQIIGGLVPVVHGGEIASHRGDLKVELQNECQLQHVKVLLVKHRVFI